MSIVFKKAVRHARKVHMALFGPTGTGKTYTLLLAMRGIVGPKGRIAVIDSERCSAQLYADVPEIGGFDAFDLPDHNPQTYIDAIEAAEREGYDGVIIDSLSHAWMGKNGALEMVDAAGRRNQGNSYAGWRDVTPLHNRLVDTMVGCKLHLGVSMRSKMEYVLEKDPKTGKSVPRKVGMQPIQRDGVEYEFDLSADMDQDHFMLVTKTRFVGATYDGKPIDNIVIEKPGVHFGEVLGQWVSSGAPQLERAQQASTTTTSTTTTKAAATGKERAAAAKAWCEGQNGTFPAWLKAAFLSICDLAERTEHASSLAVLGGLSKIVRSSEGAPTLSAALDNADMRWVIKQIGVEKLGLGWGVVLHQLAVEAVGAERAVGVLERITQHGAHLTPKAAYDQAREAMRLTGDELKEWWGDVAKFGFPGVELDAATEQPAETTTSKDGEDDIPWEA